MEDKEGLINGIDIGTGASCIYPLLGCKLNPNWNFLAVEINEVSIEFATNNVERNQFTSRIRFLTLIQCSKE
jgi:23S rRNA A1618 N6-methylase RlmF